MNAGDNLLALLPGLDFQEMAYIRNLVRQLNESELQQFAAAYSSRRKDPQTILITALIGFIGVAGIHRFLTEEPGMGILYLLTGGLCGIGTLLDVFGYKKIAFEYNRKQAQEVVAMVKPLRP